MLSESDLDVVRDDSDAQIHRFAKGDQQSLTSVEFSKGFSSLLQPFRDKGLDGQEALARLRVKVSRIQLSGDQVSAQALIFANGRTGAGAVQVNATLDTQWQLAQSGPVLKTYHASRWETKNDNYQSFSSASLLGPSFPITPCSNVFASWRMPCLKTVCTFRVLRILSSGFPVITTRSANFPASIEP